MTGLFYAVGPAVCKNALRQAAAPQKKNGGHSEESARLF